MGKVFIAIAVLVVPSVLCSQDSQPHHDHATMTMTNTVPVPGSAPILITINPEARVSVALTGAPPPPGLCGSAVEWPVKIVNQGFVTARLEAELVGDVSPGVTLQFQPEPLRGVPEEMRMLRLTLASPGQIDLTVAFRTRNEMPDLGGHDRIHFLMRCRKS